MSQFRIENDFSCDVMSRYAVLGTNGLLATFYSRTDAEEYVRWKTDAAPSHELTVEPDTIYKGLFRGVCSGGCTWSVRNVAESAALRLHREHLRAVMAVHSPGCASPGSAAKYDGATFLGADGTVYEVKQYGDDVVGVKTDRVMASASQRECENGSGLISEFEYDLGKLINRHSLENESSTPDFILASYLRSCLDAFNAATGKRERWYGRGRGCEVMGMKLHNRERDAKCGRHFQMDPEGLWHQCCGHRGDCCVCGCGVAQLTPEARTDTDPQAREAK